MTSTTAPASALVAPALRRPLVTDVDLEQPCAACNAEAGEECRPDCIGLANHLDHLIDEAQNAL